MLSKFCAIAGLGMIILSPLLSAHIGGCSIRAGTLIFRLFKLTITSRVYNISVDDGTLYTNIMNSCQEFIILV